MAIAGGAEVPESVLQGDPVERRPDLAIAWAVFVPLAYLPNFAPKRSVDLASLTLFGRFLR